MFTHTGGANPIGQLFLGGNSGSTGSYNLSGTGQLSAVVEYIGSSGTGTFTQTGGANSISSSLLGFNSGSSGTYKLTGGTSFYNHEKALVLLRLILVAELLR